jgi:cation transport regulator
VPAGQVKAPDVLSGHAAEIFVSAFNAAWSGTCKGGGKTGDQEGCAHAVAWAAVKNKYKKDSDGNWVERGQGGVVMDNPFVPKSLGEDAGHLWLATFSEILEGDESDPRAQAALAAWEAVRRNFTEDSLGNWNPNDHYYGDYDSAYCERREFSRQKRKELAGKGKALPWGGFPIENCEDVGNAVRAIGRAKDRSRTISHIIRHAKRLGCSGKVPKRWMAGKTGVLKKSSFGEGNAAIVLRGMDRSDHKQLIEMGYSNEPAQRPDFIPSADWVKMHPSEKTVGAILRIFDEAESYEAAVEREIAAGWEAKPNPTRPEEMIFKKWVDGLGSLVLVRAILVRKSDNFDWYIKEVSRGQASTLALRVAPDEVRYHRPFDLTERAQGFFGHKGRPGSRGGSLPAAEGLNPLTPTAARKVLVGKLKKAKTPIQIAQVLKEFYKEQAPFAANAIANFFQMSGDVASSQVYNNLAALMGYKVGRRK